MKKQKFICVLSFAQLSLLEIARLKDSGEYAFDIMATSAQTALIECDGETVKHLSRAFGGVYKVARACGNSIEGIEDCLPLPDEPKFNWTISGYCCSAESLESAKEFVSVILKKSSLGKSRFVRPESGLNISELKIADLKKTVLVNDQSRSRGFDIVVDSCNVPPNFGYTEFLSDVDGFLERDLSRPYQDPTLTVGTRVARSLVNLCGLKRQMTILDPFCGVGTILQEALVMGLNAVGVEISSAEASRSRENLEWLRRRFRLSSKLFVRIIRSDSMYLEKSNLPRIDAIATEPILVPKLERNPDGESARKIIGACAEKYSRAFSVFRDVLNSESPVAIIAPDLIDDRGRVHGLDLFQIAEKHGFSPLRPVVSGAENPCRVPTTKRKIIQRKVFLMKRE